MTAKVLWLNISIILIIFAAVEAVLSWQDGKSMAELLRVHLRAYEAHSDDILGYTLIKNTRRHAKKFFEDKLLYDVVVTVGDNGLRIMPFCRGDCTRAILFFGCSFTFGQGVNDDETMPYQTGLLTGGQYVTYNFGVHGYGPHQMLAAIENGWVASRVKEDVRYIIYQALYPEHLYRVAGLRIWQRHDPKYTLGEDGRPRYSGHFDDAICPRWVCTWVHRQMEKSALLKKIRHEIQAFPKVDDALFVAIVSKSLELLIKKYPNAEFHMMVWEQVPSDLVLNDLRKQGIKLHLIKDVLPFWWQPKFKISADDGHPNALAHGIVSRYVMRHIIRD